MLINHSPCGEMESRRKSLTQIAAYFTVRNFHSVANSVFLFFLVISFASK